MGAHPFFQLFSHIRLTFEKTTPYSHFNKLIISDIGRLWSFRQYTDIHIPLTPQTDTAHRAHL